MEYRPRDHEGEVRKVDATWKNPAPAVTDADRYLAEGKSVMFLTTCSYMLQYLIRTLRETGTPFHNPYRRRNGAWNPLQKRRGQTSTADRVLAFLGIQEKGMWSVEDLIHWTEMTKVKGVLQAKGRETVRNLTNGADGEVGWDGIPTVLTEEAVEAGLQGDLDWFEANMTSTKKNAAKFPLAIGPEPGPGAVGPDSTGKYRNGALGERSGGGRCVPLPRREAGPGWPSGTGIQPRGPRCTGSSTWR